MNDNNNNNNNTNTECIYQSAGNRSVLRNDDWEVTELSSSLSEVEDFPVFYITVDINIQQLFENVECWKALQSIHNM